jgi:Cysteine-rich CPCC
MPADQNREEQEAAGRLWFERYVEKLDHGSVVRPCGKQKYHCPCCGHRTLDERGGFEICPVCFWEDDGQDDHDAGEVRGGPNGALSLAQARKNFGEFGAAERRFIENVRPPKEDEKPG